MNGTVESDLAPDFKWSPEYDQVLETLASLDYAPHDWDRLRDMIKYKLKENIASYLSDPPPPPPPEPPAAPEQPSVPPQSAATATTLSPGVLPTQGAKFPPFPRRPESQFIRNEFNSYGRQKALLSEEKVKEAFESVCKLLHEFEGNPPFTIQRVCELVVRPRQHFKYLGKYLRAVERSLLVTSTIDAFPVIGPEENAASSSLYISVGSLREATTPLFSPIPFLHEDARRSRSRSPPMSPLNLATTPGSTGAGEAGTGLSPSVEPLNLGDSVIVPPDSPVIGLVDELDDPGPGHLSDHPTALSSTTSASASASSSASSAGSVNAETVVIPANSVSAEAAQAAQSGKALFGGSLQERFVKGSDAEMGEASSSSETNSGTGGGAPSATGAGAAESSPSTGSTANSNDANNANEKSTYDGAGGSDAEAVNATGNENDADKENVPKS